MLFRIPIPSSIAGKSFKLIGPTCESKAEALYSTNFPFSIGCVGGLMVRVLSSAFEILIIRSWVQGSVGTFIPRLRV